MNNKCPAIDNDPMHYNNSGKATFEYCRELNASDMFALTTCNLCHEKGHYGVFCPYISKPQNSQLKQTLIQMYYDHYNNKNNSNNNSGFNSRDSGGYRVVPEVVEFWQGQPSRLHDRLRYFKKNGEWKIERLAP